MNESGRTVQLVSGPLQTERLPDGSRRLLRSIKVKVRDKEIMVPAGFSSDFSSLPLLSQILIDSARVDLAGVIHDRLYVTGQFTRCETDTIWRLMAQSGECHANLFQAWLGWLLIRLGARFAWDRARKKSRLL
ncbi:DUF1353 domain-containing protein [Gimesia algae]|uniref:DUF1353 domain-containing protein n=1 Tax=Gimesia algae TaxID=2527971 RepID=A0A517V8H4_9PLAN|nr:DUF1353 domain-containing protein [Gimesia algae]QDT89282.1 hypothetical protein Pan161_09100 [Gimesia algae]